MASSEKENGGGKGEESQKKGSLFDSSEGNLEIRMGRRCWKRNKLY